MLWSTAKLDLVCFPPVPEHVAQPWDAADEYMLEQARPDASTLIMNDRFGALSLCYPTALRWQESACARLATEQNAARNTIGLDSEGWLTRYPANISQVLIKVPKDFELLQHWLLNIQQTSPNASVILAGMAKHIPVNWLKWLELHAGNYQQHPIRKKARLIELADLNVPDSCHKPTGYDWNTLRLEALPGVFGRHQLDIGSRFLLETLADSDIQITGRVCDLGCGNGLLGLALKQQSADLDVVLTDDSLLAVDSARGNAVANHLPVAVYHGDTLSAVEGLFDCIVCNPPFHDGHRQMTNFAQRMFEQSAPRLTPTGQLLVVANRHLPYLPMLKRLYKQVHRVKQNTKFIIYRCAGSRHPSEKH